MLAKEATELMKCEVGINQKTKTVLCVACSAGGHLTEALLAIKYVKFNRYFVTYGEEHVRSRLQGEDVCYVVNPYQNPLLHLKNAWQSLRILIRKRPKIIVSTGASVAIATCILGKMMGCKIIFIETGARVKTPSLTGTLLYPISDVFLVQWKALLNHYPKAIYGGPLL